MSEATVAIIGAGPIGLELAAALKQAGVDYLHFEGGQIGQTVSRYPKMTRFFSSASRIALCGVPLVTADQSKASREEYLAYLRGIVTQFDLEILTYHRVTEIEKSDEGFTLQTDHQGEVQRHRVRNIVLATGDMSFPRLLHIPGEDMGHVSHDFDEPHRYFRKRLLIVGGKNSAIEAAVRCHHAGAEVSLSYRQAALDPQRIKYWLLPEVEALIKAKKIKYYPSTLPAQITATEVTLRPTGEGQGPAVKVDADFVLLLTGYVMDTTLFKMLGVALEGENTSPVFDPRTMRTNVPGVYVAGTSAAGTQVSFKLFIENCHIHVPRIVAALTGQAPPDEMPDQAPPHQIPES